MNILSCFENFKNDRICEICAVSCHEQHEYCEKITKLKENIIQPVYSCAYKKEEYDYSERERYWTCMKYGGNCDIRKKCKKQEIENRISEYEKTKEEYIKRINSL